MELLPERYRYGEHDEDAEGSKRESRFVFDPVEVWGLNATGTSAAAAASATATSGNVVSSAVASAEAHLKNSTEALEDKLLGKTGREAMDAYRKVATWMFLAYEISFWTTLATIVCGILAIFSRWGSFLTWLFSVVCLLFSLQHIDMDRLLTRGYVQVSTFFTVAAVLTSTILFGTVVGAFKTLLHPYHVQLSLGTHSLILNWLAVAFSVGATLFWLLSVCCCSGRSNPHHRSNKGGLWQAESKGQGYGDFRGRGGVRVEKTGGGYERVGSPVWGQGSHGGQEVPLQSYPQQGYAQQTPQHGHQQGGAFEPFRHG